MEVLQNNLSFYSILSEKGLSVKHSLPRGTYPFTMKILRNKGPFNRQSIHIISRFLFTLGINVSNTENFSGEIRRLIIITSPPFCTLVGTSMYVYTNRHDFDEMIKVAAYFSTCAILMITLLHLFANKTKIKTLIRRLDHNVYQYPDEDVIEVKYAGIFKDENSYKITIMVFYYACFGFALSAMSPIIGFLITGVYVTSIYPSWFPWSQEGPLLKSFTLVFQGYICFVVFWICYTLELFLIFLVVEFLKQYERLCVALSTIHSRTNESLSSSELNGAYNEPTNGISFSGNKTARFPRHDCREMYDEVFRQKIIQCIKHHQEIHRLFKLFQPWFLVFFSSELFFSIMTFALVFYNVLKTSLSSDPSFFLTIVGSGVNVFALLFCRCFVGEMFFDMHNNVLNAIFYDVNWVEQSKSNRQLLLLFHLFAKRCHSLKAFSIFPASYYTFAALMRSSYSYFNLLNTSLGKNGKID